MRRGKLVYTETPEQQQQLDREVAQHPGKLVLIVDGHVVASAETGDEMRRLMTERGIRGGLIYRARRPGDPTTYIL